MCPKCKSRNFKICNNTLKCKKCGVTDVGHKRAVKGWRTRRKTSPKLTESRKTSFNALGALLVLWAIGTAVALPFQSSTVLYSKAYAETVQNVPNLGILEPNLRKTVESETISEKIDRYAKKYDVSADEIYRTLACESQNFIDPAIQAKFVGTKGRERSFGYAQIHLTSHPHVSYEQAIDPDFAIEFTAKNWKKHKDWWVCARKLGI